MFRDKAARVVAVVVAVAIVVAVFVAVVVLLALVLAVAVAFVAPVVFVIGFEDPADTRMMIPAIGINAMKVVVTLFVDQSSILRFI